MKGVTRFQLIWIIFSLSVMCCKQTYQGPDPGNVVNAKDTHTYAQPEVARVTHLSLDLTVDFDSKVLSGSAHYQMDLDSNASEIILDMHRLEIDSILIGTTGSMRTASYQIGEEKPFMGSPLTIETSPSDSEMTIFYKTHPEALALQWLNPQQTLGKEHPFLFTQGQAILTRSWIPCQDSPGIRYTYEANIKVPAGLMAVMSATNPQSKSDDGSYRFTMEQPITSYLMALAVGDIAFSSIGDRTGVYAEPGMLEAASYEMADLEKMVVATEELYGPYQWDRFDLIILPPSFPFGGMENPKLTFATPTIIAGDRSLTSLVAHELAHSWSGNLVTNATWDDFWLNEGHTVYLERRIMEALYGKEYADMLALLGLQDLQSTIDDLGPEDDDTHLKLDLEGRDPDEGMTDVAYEKGYLLLRTLEELAGREVFDQYLKSYFEKYQFQSIGTDKWVAYVNKYLIHEQDLTFSVEEWVYGPGIPDNAAQISSDRFAMVDRRVSEFDRIGRLDRSTTRGWSTHEWLHFIRQLPHDLHVSFYEKLDTVFDFSNSGNSEILAAWLELSIRSGYMPDHNQAQLEAFLTRVGRRKFLTPLYRALKETDQLDLARQIFDQARPNYHSVSSRSIAELLEEEPAI